MSGKTEETRAWLAGLYTGVGGSIVTYCIFTGQWIMAGVIALITIALSHEARKTTDTEPTKKF